MQTKVITKVCWGVFALFLQRFVVAAPQLASEFVVPDGLEVTLWAESPLFCNPTSIDVDYRGRIWVAEAVNYRTFRKPDRNQPEAAAFRRPEGDRILILEDADGDGVADSSKVFVQDKDLIAPLGVGVVGNRVFVSCSPHLLVYTLDSAGDRPVKKEIFLTGFGGRDHDHGLHSVVAGPDGRLYFNVGNAGPHIVTDRGGWTLRSGSIYTGGSPYNTNNTPGLRSDDGRAWTGGLALRVDADGGGLAVLAHNFRNSYEVTIDSFGNLWQNDNDDEVQACRTSWILPGGNMGFFSADGSRSWRADQRPGQPTPRAQWHQDDPGVVPAGDIYGAGGPTGVAVYEGDLLQNFRGMVLNADAGRNTVFGHVPHAEGAGFRLERTIFLSSRRDSTEGYRWDHISMEDRSTWFRPSDVAVGTDGVIYVADWYDPVVGGHAMRDSQGYGRILRVAPKGDRTRTPKIDPSTTAGALAAFRSPAINVRYLGYEHLASHPPNERELRRLASDTNPFVRARAWWLFSKNLRALGLKPAGINEQIVQFRRETQFDASTLLALAGNTESALRREAALACRDLAARNALPVLLEIARRYDGKDRFYLEALGIGAGGKEEALYSELAKPLSSGGPLHWPDTFARLVWRLHPSSSVAAVTVRARADVLSLEARKLAVDTLAFTRCRAAADAMVDLAFHASTDELRRYALWWARHRAGNDWKAFDSVARLGAEGLSEEERLTLARVQALRHVVLSTNAPYAERTKAAASLAVMKEGGLAFIALAQQGRVPEAVRATVTEEIYRNPDFGVRALASQYFTRTSLDGTKLPPIAELAKLRGDAKRGRALFNAPTAGCAQCHRFGAEGRDVGPDLSAIRTKFDKAGVLDAILNPSAAVAFGYEPWVITTRDDETYTGFLLADGDPVVLKDTSGTERRLAARDIASKQKQTLSIMPDNIAVGLSAQDLDDLVEFLLTSGNALEKADPQKH